MYDPMTLSQSYTAQPTELAQTVQAKTATAAAPAAAPAAKAPAAKAPAAAPKNDQPPMLPSRRNGAWRTLNRPSSTQMAQTGQH